MQDAITNRHQLMTKPEVAKLIGVSVKTLDYWRTHGIGPVGRKIGTHVRFRRAEVEAWIDKQFVDPDWDQSATRNRPASR